MLGNLTPSCWESLDRLPCKTITATISTLALVGRGSIEMSVNIMPGEEEQSKLLISGCRCNMQGSISAGVLSVH